MECCATAIDPEEECTPQRELTSPRLFKDQADAKPWGTGKTTDQRTAPVNTDAANVGDPRLANPRSVNSSVPAPNYSGNSNHPSSADDAAHSHFTDVTTCTPGAVSLGGNDKKHTDKSDNPPTTKAASLAPFETF